MKGSEGEEECLRVLQDRRSGETRKSGETGKVVFFFYTDGLQRVKRASNALAAFFRSLRSRRADLNLDDGARAVRLSRSAARYFGPAACVSPRETNNALLPLRGVPCSIDSGARVTGTRIGKLSRRLESSRIFANLFYSTHHGK